MNGFAAAAGFGRRALTGLLLLAALSFIKTAIAAPRCSLEKQLCRDHELAALDISVEKSYSALQCLSDSEANLTQGYWRRDLNLCKLDAHPDACARKHLRSRIDWLKARPSCDGDPSSLRYEMPDPVYLQAHPDLYVGTRTAVQGTLVLDNCESGAVSLWGTIRGRTPKLGSLRVRFDRLSTEDRAFLCERLPFAAWEGHVSLEDGAPAIYLSDLLGRPLR